MKLVILDAYTVNPGDLSWAELSDFGEVELYDRTAPDQVVPRIGDADAVLTNKVVITREILEQTPNVKYIGVMATGYNVVDLEAAAERGIMVTNVPYYSSDSVAQHAFALILALTNHVADYNDSVWRGDWADSPDFTYFRNPVIELAGKTLGIYGFGAIGRRVEAIAIAFGMKVIAHRRSIAAGVEVAGTTYVSLDELLEQSDVLTLHAPLTEENEGVIDKDALTRMKRSALLINTARGGLVVESDLAAALNEGLIAGAAIDVASEEPLPKDNPLMTAKNLIITPHIAYASPASRRRLVDTIARNFRHVKDGHPSNVILDGKAFTELIQNS